MNKKILYRLIPLLLLLIVTITSTFAWLTNADQTESINGSSSGIYFNYTIDDNTYNSETFSVSNVAFFDIDNEYESDDFVSMATLVTITVKNESVKPIDYTISQVAPDKSGAYILAFFSTTQITELSGTIEELHETTESINVQINAYDQNVDNTITIYMYVIGVQPNDNATNDFFSNTYSLSIQMSATQI